MDDSFEEQVFREIDCTNKKSRIIKSDDAEIVGKTKISFEEDENEKVKIVLKKDENDTIKNLNLFVLAVKLRQLYLIMNNN